MEVAQSRQILFVQKFPRKRHHNQQKLLFFNGKMHQKCYTENGKKRHSKNTKKNMECSMRYMKKSLFFCSLTIIIRCSTFLQPPKEHFLFISSSFSYSIEIFFHFSLAHSFVSAHSICLFSSLTQHTKKIKCFHGLPKNLNFTSYYSRLSGLSYLFLFIFFCCFKKNRKRNEE